MRKLSNIEIFDVSGGGDFNYGELADLMVQGAITGGLTGATSGGLGIVSGALEGAAFAGVKYVATQLALGGFHGGDLDPMVDMSPPSPWVPG